MELDAQTDDVSNANRRRTQGIQPAGLSTGASMMPETCTYYTRVAFGMLRCRGATLSGKCGHPDKLCPVNRQYQQERKIDYVW
jgi:hypothetical protein